MLIKTYNTNDDINVTDKSLSEVSELDIKLKNDMEVLAPTIVLSGAIPSFNYCYIPQFKRYYFADRPTKGNNDIYYISLKCDRLMSFKDQIRNSYGVVKRSENIPNNYLNDGSWKTDIRRTTDIINFGGGFNDSPSYILMTCGDTL